MYSEINDVENEIEIENEINGIDNGNINLDSDYQNLLSLEERKIIDKLNNVSNDTKKYLKKNKEFFNISLKELFDNFLKQYSFEKRASHARLRIATSYDLVGRNPKIVLKLYKDAIDRSADPAVRYEAALRYYGYSYLRKLKQRDVELNAFIEPPIEIERNISSVSASHRSSLALSVRSHTLSWRIACRWRILAFSSLRAHVFCLAWSCRCLFIRSSSC